jgi:PAS domain S-box-containing protein
MAPNALNGQQTQLLRHVIQSADDLVVVTDLAGKILFVNDACLKFYGYDKHELIGTHVSILQSPKNPPGYCAAAHEQTLRGHWAGELVDVTKDGREVVIFCSSSVVRDESGKPIAAVGISRDITQLKKAEQALRESEERYRILIDFCPEAIVVHDGVRYVYINPAGLKLFGATSPTQIIGKPIMDFVHPDYRQIVAARVKDVAHDRKSTPLLEQKLVRLDGTTVDVEVTATPINHFGKTAVIVVMRDISRRKQAEQALGQSILAGQPQPPAATDKVALTAREREIVRLVALGRSNKRVAAVLGISVRTVETHRRNVMKKLNLTSVADLVRFAILQNIVQS